MVKFVIRKKEFDFDGKLIKIEARKYPNRIIFRDINVIWSIWCSNVHRTTFTIKKRNKYYTPIKKQHELKQEKIQKELTREEKRQQCKCKEKCKSEFECGIF